MYQGSEFSSCKIELRNWVTQNDVKLWVTNWKGFYRNSPFELLTRLRKTFEGLTFFFHFRVINSRLKKEKIQFELKTRIWKIKNYTSS